MTRKTWAGRLALILLMTAGLSTLAVTAEGQSATAPQAPAAAHPTPAQPFWCTNPDRLPRTPDAAEQWLLECPPAARTRSGG